MFIPKSEKLLIEKLVILLISIATAVLVRLQAAPQTGLVVFFIKAIEAMINMCPKGYTLHDVNIEALLVFLKTKKNEKKLKKEKEKEKKLKNKIKKKKNNKKLKMMGNKVDRLRFKLREKNSLIIAKKKKNVFVREGPSRFSTRS